MRVRGSLDQLFFSVYLGECGRSIVEFKLERKEELVVQSIQNFGHVGQGTKVRVVRRRKARGAFGVSEL